MYTHTYIRIHSHEISRNFFHEHTYMYIYIYIYTHTHTGHSGHEQRVHAYISQYVLYLKYTGICNMHTYIYIYTHTHTGLSGHERRVANFAQPQCCLKLGVSTCKYVYKYIYMCTCIYLHISICK